MKLYTAEETAEILSISKWTVWKYGREGRLRTVKFGRTVRYDLEGGENDQDGNGMDGDDNGMGGIRFHGGSRDRSGALERRNHER